MGEVQSPTLTISSASATTRRSKASSERRRWAPLFQHAIELSHGHSTRFGISETSRGQEFVQSSLDRAYIAMHFIGVAQLRFTYSLPPPVVAGTAAAEHSDHLAVTTTASRRLPTAPGRRPIPPWVVRHPLYAVFSRQRIDKLRIETITPVERWRRVEQALRAAAAATRNAVLASQPASPQACVQRAMQLVSAL